MGECLKKQAPDFEYPELSRQALLRGHCHHKSLWQTDDEVELMARMKLDFELLDSGCCGMAGSFGFERGEKYRVSMQVGERRLLPAVRAANTSTLIVADGFSCREQIRQGTDREAMHLAEVIQLGLQASQGDPAEYPERKLPHHGMSAALEPWRPSLVCAAALIALGAKRALGRHRRDSGRLDLGLGALTVGGAVIAVLAAGQAAEPAGPPLRARRARASRRRPGEPRATTSRLLSDPEA